MSGHGAPVIGADELVAAGKAGMRAVIVAASWHTQIMDGLIDGAKRAAIDAGIQTPDIVRVPGTFELPVAAARLAPDYDTVIALGVVIRGGTPHFDYVCQGATLGLTDVSVRTGVPGRLRRIDLRQRRAGNCPCGAGRLRRGQGL